MTIRKKLGHDWEKRGNDVVPIEKILMTIKKNWITMGNDLENLGDGGVTIEKNLVSIRKTE